MSRFTLTINTKARVIKCRNEGEKFEDDGEIIRKEKQNNWEKLGKNSANRDQWLVSGHQNTLASSETELENNMNQGKLMLMEKETLQCF